MDLSEVKYLVAQFLFENDYTDTLASFERESGVKFENNLSTKTSKLLSILGEFKELTRERTYYNALTIKEGDGEFCNEMLSHFQGLVGGVNILAVRLSYDGVLFLGSVQGLLSTLQLETPISKDSNANHKIPYELQVHSAGLIAIDVFSTETSHMIVTGSMDRKCCLLEMKQNDEPRLVESFQDHTKFVVKVRWSNTGKFFVSASYDCSICIYRKCSNESMHYNLLKRMKFKGQIEGISFKKQQDMIIVSVRNDNCLHVIDMSLEDPSQVKTINMNLIGDDFVSFTAMDVSCSPDDNFLIVSTDNNRIIMFDLNSGNQILNLYGSINDEFSQPRSCWHPSGKYIYSTSQDRCIIVWEVASQKVVKRLRGHTGIVRDLWYCEPLSVLVSCGFDGDVRIWHYREEITSS